mmetsp:Transcript_99992/g.158272  ORF Transcript_99992/g.158272 Transcript_99992/m.158272 type:complete len:116 (+) Transcript_99992:51-398(+)|eukprot:CAMPEP_0169129776 /NCGR_PEP_ID=MMETSP1015-20121227/37331_1 /TAXON_ID=342587 /ORGANISM="Karlodinium micrum, Strain CCMP2283" /LENGTH=115 /DNA_ID=CAMNT_0009193867 /DNA_START=49 /DNA_END=399 /DNA_ORIENTATION=-
MPGTTAYFLDEANGWPPDIPKPVTIPSPITTKDDDDAPVVMSVRDATRQEIAKVPKSPLPPAPEKPKTQKTKQIATGAGGKDKAVEGKLDYQTVWSISKDVSCPMPWSFGTPQRL